jgi:hypothetical protein
MKDKGLAKAIRVLNEALEADPVAMESLFKYRVSCNEKLADHPTIQVRGASSGSECTVGLLGFINGVFAMNDKYIGMVIDLDNQGEIVRFEEVKR